MRITTALLADGAHVQAGKLYVLGGAFDTINARSVPVTHKVWTLVLVAEVEQGERQRDLSLRITLVDEDESAPLVDAEARLRVGAPPTLRPGDVSVVPLAVPLPEVTFPAAKGYLFRVEYSGREMARIPFRVAMPDSSPA
jgi:hypothetical protein